MSSADLLDGRARARSNDHLRTGSRVHVGDSLMSTTTGDRIKADKLLVRLRYVTRRNRHETLAEFCARVDHNPDYTGKLWRAATMRVAGETVSLKAIDGEQLRDVCRFLAEEIRKTPTQTDDARWYPDSWEAAADSFPAKDKR